VVDLSDEPLAQLETIINELHRMRIRIMDNTEDEEQAVLRHKKALIVGNKIDLAQTSQSDTALLNKYQDLVPVIVVSAREGTGLEALRLKTYQMLDIIRIYTKTPGSKPDFDDPIILERGSTLEDAAAEEHKDFQAKLKYARIWGSGKHDGVMVKREHVLQDGDIIELHV
jgi:ribosome-interacting GTPase 1